MFQSLKEWLQRGLRPTRWCGQIPEPLECLISGHLFTTTSRIYQVWPLTRFFCLRFPGKKISHRPRIGNDIALLRSFKRFPRSLTEVSFFRGWGCHTHTSFHKWHFQSYKEIRFLACCDQNWDISVQIRERAELNIFNNDMTVSSLQSYVDHSTIEGDNGQPQ